MKRIKLDRELLRVSLALEKARKATIKASDKAAQAYEAAAVAYDEVRASEKAFVALVNRMWPEDLK